MQQAAAFSYVFFALPVLPTLVPIAVLMLEPRGSRLRITPFVALGAVVSAYMLQGQLDGPLQVEEQRHALVYHLGLDDAVPWSMLYAVAFSSLWCVYAAVTSVLIFST